MGRLEGAFAGITRRLGVYHLVLGLAGAAGGALDAVVSHVVEGNFLGTAGACAWIGGGIGLGIGTTLALTRRWWAAIPLAPALGFLGYGVAGTLATVVEGRPEWPSLGELLNDEFACRLAAVAAPVLVLAHLLFLSVRGWKRGVLHGVWLYAVLGAISGSVFWYFYNNDRSMLPTGLLNGAVYGQLQLLGMLTAHRLEPKPRVQEPD